MEYANIRAPFSGVVIKRHVDPGALIQQASSQTNVSPVVTIAQNDKMRVFVEVNEAEIRFIRRGSPAALTVDALPGMGFNGLSARYTSALDPKTRTMKTEIDIPNRNGPLRPGMFGSVKLTLERHENALTVPASALISQGAKSYVYTVVDNKVKRAEVQTGFDDGSTIEITSGLSDNDLVIISGKSEMQDGTLVKVLNAS
jgi:RND family efflux transporter MFP subunit